MAPPSPKPGFRRPLQPKNIFTPTQPTKPPQVCQEINIINNKENFRVVVSPIESIDVSLAEELSAVREKMERLRLDREKTEKMLEERSKLIEFRLYEFVERGEFQRELEIEVDRLFRLKQLHVASMVRMSPIRPLRKKETEKKCQDAQFQSTKTDESNKAELANNGSSTTESTRASTSSASISTSTLNPTATSKMSLFMPRLSLECASVN